MKTNSNKKRKTFDPGVELDVLRAIFSNPSSVHQVLQYSSSVNLFKKPKYQLVWSIILNLTEEQKKVDASLVRSRAIQNNLTTEDKIDDILYEITKVDESAKHIDDWASELTRLYSLRQMNKIMGSAKAMIHSGRKGPEEIEAYVNKNLQDISIFQPKEPLEDVMETFLSDIEKHRKSGVIRSGLKVGIPALDKTTNGFGDTYLVIYAATPKAGKTTLAVQNLDNVVENTDRYCIVVTLEMSREQLLSRWSSLRAMVPGQKIRKAATITDEEWDRLQREGERIRQWCAEGRVKFITQHDFNGSPTADKIYNTLLAENSKKRVGFCVLDYFQLFSGNNVEEREKASIKVNSISKSLQIPTLLISQFNRSVVNEQRAPRFTDMHGTGQLEKDVDVLVLMDRKDMRVDRAQWSRYGVQERVVDFSLPLHRHGPTNQWKMKLHDGCPVFVTNSSLNLEQDNYEEMPSVLDEL